MISRRVQRSKLFVSFCEQFRQHQRIVRVWFPDKEYRTFDIDFRWKLGLLKPFFFLQKTGFRIVKTGLKPVPELWRYVACVCEVWSTGTYQLVTRLYVKKQTRTPLSRRYYILAVTWFIVFLWLNTRSSADADNRLDAFSGQSRSTNIVPFHMLHIVSTFLLCNSNTVFKTRRFYDIRLQKISWPWNGGQRSLKVIESGIIR